MRSAVDGVQGPGICAIYENSGPIRVKQERLPHGVMCIILWGDAMTEAQIQEELIRRIRSREFSPGSRIPSMRELARTFGVSHALIQQAVKVLVAQGYLVSQIGRGTFVPESPIAGKTVALVLPSLGPEHMRDIIRGVKVGLGGDACRLLLQVADSDYGEQLEMLSGLTDALVAGAIVYPPPYAKYAAQLSELVDRWRVPVVLVDTELPGVDADSVTTHGGQLGRLAVQPLRQRGHTQIGILDKDVDSTSEELRRMGMAEELAEAEIDFATLPRLRVPMGRAAQASAQRRPADAVRDFLNEHRELTAVVATDDGLAVHCLRAARRLGLRIPDDLSLVAIGDVRAFEIVDPPVTAVRQPHAEIGRVAAQRLLQRLAGDTSPAQSAWLRPELVERGSVRTLHRE